MLLLRLHCRINSRGTIYSSLLLTYTECIAHVSTAHLLHPLRRRRLPLGFRDAGPPLWPRPRLLHRFPQLLWLDIRLGIHRLHPVKRGRADVCRIPPRPRHQAVARLRRFRPHNLVLLRPRSIWEPSTTSLEPDRVIPSHRWGTYNHHRSRSHAQSACQ